MRVLVVDDEPLARSRLRRMLEKISAIEAIAEAENGRRALEQIQRFNPSVVLLDIRMPGISGLDVARATSPNLAIIFTTAYDEHAVEAFEVTAIDYLLKPIRQDRLEKALERARNAVQANQGERVTQLYDRLQEAIEEESVSRITARQGDSLRVFDAVQIDRFRAAAGYTSFRHAGEEFLLDETLNTLEERLKPLGFLRVHRSELIRIAAVRAIHKIDGVTSAELAGGEYAPVSRRLLPELKTALDIK